VALLPALVAAVAVSGCDTKEPTDPTVTGVELAKGGGAGPKVNSTDPPGAEQETTLDVRVLGSGFDEGSEVTFLLDSLPVGTMHTNSVTFVSRKELRANLTIDLAAAIDLYDVEVYTRGGKRGIGADLFQVVEKGSGGPPWGPTNMRVWLPTEVRSGVDNMLDPDPHGPYDGGVCGVRVWYTTDEQRSLTFQPIDYVLGTNKRALREAQACTEFPRKAWFDLLAAKVHISDDHTDDPTLEDYIENGNADPITILPDEEKEIGKGMIKIPTDDDQVRSAGTYPLNVADGTMELRNVAFNLAYCLDDGWGSPFLFWPDREPDSDPLEVERDGGVFHLRTQPFPDNIGHCSHTRADGSNVILLLHMDLAYNVTSLPGN
jgi:hypothetical protein